MRSLVFALFVVLLTCASPVHALHDSGKKQPSTKGNDERTPASVRPYSTIGLSPTDAKFKAWLEERIDSTVPASDLIFGAYRPVPKAMALAKAECAVTPKKFDWPKTVTTKTLQASVNGYSKSVGCCLGEPSTAGQKAWGVCRNDLQKTVFTSLKEDGIKKGCDKAKELFVEKTYKGDANFCQFGNCAEGAIVFGCLGYQAGLDPGKEIQICLSDNDHGFALLTVDKKKCIADRFDVIGKGNFFCGVTVKDGTVHVDGKATNDPKKWYQDLNCPYMSRLFKKR